MSRSHRAGGRRTPLGIRIRHRRRRIQGSRVGKGCFRSHFRSAHCRCFDLFERDCSTASSRCRRCQTTWLGRVKRIHVRDDLYLSRGGRIDVGALGVFGRLAGVHPAEEQFHHATTRGALEEVGSQRAARLDDTPEPSTSRCRTATVGRHEGVGEMTQPAAGRQTTSSPAQMAGASSALLLIDSYSSTMRRCGMAWSMPWPVRSAPSATTYPGSAPAADQWPCAARRRQSSPGLRPAESSKGIDGPAIVVGHITSARRLPSWSPRSIRTSSRTTALADPRAAGRWTAARRGGSRLFGSSAVTALHSADWRAELSPHRATSSSTRLADVARPVVADVTAHDVDAYGTTGCPTPRKL